MTMLAAVGQFCGTNNVLKNLDTCRSLIRDAASRGVKMLFLPEASDFIAEDRSQTLTLTEPIERGVFISGIQEEAARCHIWISVGIHEPAKSPSYVYNTNLVVDGQGQMIARYRKLHLFDVDIKDGPNMLESATTTPGDKITSPIATPIGKLGLCVCYDLRFPELSRRLRELGAQWLVYPSAFTVKTGQAHWEVLLRARAIENQCYVAAAAHVGWHNEKRESFGHAMIVNPWGEIQAKCSETTRPCMAVAEVDMDLLERVRRAMPILEHRRTDLFP